MLRRYVREALNGITQPRKGSHEVSIIRAYLEEQKTKFSPFAGSRDLLRAEPDVIRILQEVLYTTKFRLDRHRDKRHEATYFEHGSCFHEHRLVILASASKRLNAPVGGR